VKKPASFPGEKIDMAPGASARRGFFVGHEHRAAAWRPSIMGIKARTGDALGTAGSLRRVFACPITVDRRLACCAVGGAIFGNQFQSRIFVGKSTDA
jgi:hypothetical protein